MVISNFFPIKYGELSTFFPKKIIFTLALDFLLFSHDANFPKNCWLQASTKIKT